jgi:hypothetical protein
VRGKDFACRLLGRSRKSLQAATRSELKVLSLPKSHAVKKQKMELTSTSALASGEPEKTPAEEGEKDREDEKELEDWLEDDEASKSDADEAELSDGDGDEDDEDKSEGSQAAEDTSSVVND